MKDKEKKEKKVKKKSVPKTILKIVGIVLLSVILIVLMFLGRVGGLTLIYAAQSARAGGQSTLPLEKITVG